MSTAPNLAAATSYFSGVQPIKYEGPQSKNPLAYRYYDKNRVVLGKRMEEQLRPAVCYWHSFAWNGHDIFGAGRCDRRWNQGARKKEPAGAKMDAALYFFPRLGAPFYRSHGVGAMPAASNIKEHVNHLA